MPEYRLLLMLTYNRVKYKSRNDAAWDGMWVVNLVKDEFQLASALDVFAIICLPSNPSIILIFNFIKKPLESNQKANI